MGSRIPHLVVVGCLLFISMAVCPAFSGEQSVLIRGAQSEPLRFKLLSELGGEAVLDGATGLIWEQAPHSEVAIWYRAKSDCGVKIIGGRRGWRLPSFFELMTLVDPSTPEWRGAPMLPTGHPFRRVRAGVYWSSDTPEQDPLSAYVVDFAAGDVATRVKTRQSGLWCVMGSPVQRVTSEKPLHLIQWAWPR
jgi:hypothetical protein